MARRGLHISRQNFVRNHSRISIKFLHFALIEEVLEHITLSNLQDSANVTTLPVVQKIWKRTEKCFFPQILPRSCPSAEFKTSPNMVDISAFSSYNQQKMKLFSRRRLFLKNANCIPNVHTSKRDFPGRVKGPLRQGTCYCKVAVWTILVKLLAAPHWLFCLWWLRRCLQKCTHSRILSDFGKISFVTNTTIFFVHGIEFFILFWDIQFYLAAIFLSCEYSAFGWRMCAGCVVEHDKMCKLSGTFSSSFFFPVFKVCSPFFDPKEYVAAQEKSLLLSSLVILLFYCVKCKPTWILRSASKKPPW